MIAAEIAYLVQWLAGRWNYALLVVQVTLWKGTGVATVEYVLKSRHEPLMH